MVVYSELSDFCALNYRICGTIELIGLNLRTVVKEPADFMPYRIENRITAC